MAKYYYGSINLSKLLQAAKEQHSGIARAVKQDGTKGDIYVNLTVWENDELDKYGNKLAIQVNPAKDSQDQKFYIGNLKPGEQRDPVQLTANDMNEIPAEDDLPF